MNNDEYITLENHCAFCGANDRWKKVTIHDTVDTNEGSEPVTYDVHRCECGGQLEVISEWGKMHYLPDYKITHNGKVYVRPYGGIR